jgi:hypothetical protein
MKIILRRFLISAQIGVLVAIAPVPSFAEDASIGAKVFDAAVLRPLGSIRLVVGMAVLAATSVLYTLTLQDADVYQETADLLIVEPANYVFRRPLGEDFSGGG